MEDTSIPAPGVPARRRRPAAIVEDGFGERQRVTITHLAAARQVRSPAVVVIGDVVALSPHASPPAG
nr:hypothetical protein [Microbacterium hydrocarbonoxydans]